MTITFSVRSYRGNIRKTNEDNFYANGTILAADSRDRLLSLDAVAYAPVILAVCDGMGGEESGEEASEIAVKKLLEMDDIIKDVSSEKLGAVIREYIDTVDFEISLHGKRMGTTLALAVITHSGVRCFNVGDTRIYYLKSGRLLPVTNDHTFGAELTKKNEMSSAQARNHRNGKKLTRCIGIGDNRIAEEYHVIRGKCRLLICSDGLTDMVDSEEIKKTLTEAANTSDASERLLRSALRHGGKDNITVVAADIPPRSLTDVISKFKETGR